MPFNYTNFVWRAITARTLFRYFEEWKIWWWWNKNSTKNESLVASNIHHRTYLSAYCGGQCRNTMHFEVMNRECTKPENPLSTPRARPLYCWLDSSPVSETSQKHFSSMSFKNLFEIYYPTICFMAKQAHDQMHNDTSCKTMKHLVKFLPAFCQSWRFDWGNELSWR